MSNNKIDMGSQLIKSSSSQNTGLSQREQNESREIDKVITPPFDFAKLIEIYETHHIAKKGIELFAKRVAYSWYDIIQDWEEEADKDDLDNKIGKIQDFLKNINKEESFEDILYAMATDYRITWNCAVEVARNSVNEVEKLYSIPIKNLRILKKWDGYRTGQRYAEILGGIWDDIYYNKYYPESDERNEENGFWENLNKDWIPTTELWFLKDKNPWNKWYWSCLFSSLLKSIIIKNNIDNWHIEEFEKAFLNKIAIVVEGGSITPDSVQTISDYLEEIRTNRDWAAIPMLHSANWKIRIEKLGSDINDGSYLELKKDVNQEVIVAVWVPPILLWLTENTNLANQNSQEKKFYYDEVLPFQNKLFRFFSRMIQEDLGIKGIKLIPKIPQFKDKQAEMDIISKWIEKGIYSINQWMQKMGEKPLTDDNWEELEWAKKHYVYVGWKPVPVEDLIKFTGDQAALIDIDSALENANAAAEKISNNILKWKETEKNLINYNNFD